MKAVLVAVAAAVVLAAGGAGVHAALARHGA
ncbi:MAG: hypothetical protein V7603_4317, partial [Micromonosporaceae bacterium]